MWKIVPYVLAESLMLTICQVLLKIAVMRMPAFSWSRDYLISLMCNGHLAASGVFFGLCSLLWMYIMKVFPFSTSYPMISMSYVFGMLAAMVIFHEEVTPVKWVGLVFIMVGCFLIAK
jgi:undecaprenyl phosphate-alpha-L-ara4N flippase subunit ArnE